MQITIPGINDLTSLLLFVAPGYLAYRAYVAFYDNKPSKLSETVLTSVVASFFILNAIKLGLAVFPSVVSDSLGVGGNKPPFVLVVLVLSIGLGWGFAYLRRIKWLNKFTGSFSNRDPDEDILRLVLLKNKGGWVHVELKDGRLFSGVVVHARTRDADAPRELYFEFVTWIDPETGEDLAPQQDVGLYVSLSDINYMQIEKLT